jgi:hypothetical protein
VLNFFCHINIFRWIYENHPKIQADFYNFPFSKKYIKTEVDTGGDHPYVPSSAKPLRRESDDKKKENA